MITKFSRVLFGFLLLLLVGGTAHSQQSADPLFKATVDSPAFTRNFPRVLFDEAHYNSESINGRYKPFADLLFRDGYHIVVNRKPFTKESLKTFKILVIVNPLGAEDSDDDGADGPAFTAQECDVVTDWIRGGGALLLVADPAPFAAATEILATRLGVELSKAYTTDPANSDKGSNDASVLVYSRENQLLATHAITNGRNETERVDRVMTFMGHSLKGPAGSDGFLKLADTAVDQTGSAAGRAQGVAFRLGRGRTVVLADAAMLSAQVTGSDNRPFGMNTADIDNQQLALNIMHWLSGLLK
ncbi:MAG: hypothetical protein H7Z16_00755 [Pyrinomonadaceae bacterium]|nr:hypothetical protein [Pyrinomonadaceae bacterium]